MAEKSQCSVCGNEATVHLTQIINNKIHKVDLCESCAQQKGVSDPEGYSLADLLSKAQSFSRSEGDDDTSCPDCGYTTADFNRTGRFGCATCYEVFRDVLLPVLEDMHPGTSHEGKQPETSMQRRSHDVELRRLNEALQRAVEKEEYEEAAKFRDQIKWIEASETTGANQT